MTNEELIDKAQQAMQKSYAPYSKFRVGAAILMADGTVFSGCNIENASFGLSICAERVAIFKAIAEGRRDFKALAVVCDSDNYCAPCGACRQVMTEFAVEMPVIMANRQKKYTVQSVQELIPGFFSPQDLPGGANNG